MDKKRIFIAIPASKSLQQQAMRFSNEIQAHAGLAVRWLEPKNLHITLTLTPPIEAGPERLAQIIDQLRTVTGFKPFEIHFNTVEFGPTPEEPRLIWARGETPVELFQLKGGIEKAINFHPDRTEFTMHSTLARFQPRHFDPNWRAQLQSKVHWTMLVDNFTILESKRRPEGTSYDVVEKFQLQ